MQAVQSGLWELPPTSLPDANTWPTWGALRERILTATKQINILGSAAVRDNFLSELVKLSPPELHTLVRIVTLACCSMGIQQFIVCCFELHAALCLFSNLSRTLAISSLGANGCFDNMASISSDLMITCFALQAVQCSVSTISTLHTINNTTH